MLPASQPKSWRYLALAVTMVAAASILGQIATGPALKAWYPSLVKPAFTPPNWLFPVAWTTLYALMAYAFWRILRLPAATAGRSAAIALFSAQLALNALWSWAFFGARSPFAGLVVILALDLAVAITILRFWRLDRPAAAVLLPYLGWIVFATALNGAIVLLNRS